MTRMSLWTPDERRDSAAANGLSRATGPAARFANDREILSPSWRYQTKAETLLLGHHLGELIGLANDNRHALTVAGNRGGKGISLIIPNLVLWPGSCFVLDPKGELARKTSRARRQLHGQRTVVLDPFGVSGQAQDSCNLLDGIDLHSPYVVDRITVTNIIGGWSLFMMGLQAMSAVLATLSIMSLIVDQNPVTYFLVCLFIGMTLRGILMYWPLYLSTPHRVVFTADRIEFYGLFGNEFGSLPREAMQQIAVGQKQAGKKTILFHHFMADTGWVKAMPTFSQDDVLARNNILMAAFGQPFNLYMPETSPVPITTAPDVAGLRPILQARSRQE